MPALLSLVAAAVNRQQIEHVPQTPVADVIASQIGASSNRGQSTRLRRRLGEYSTDLTDTSSVESLTDKEMEKVSTLDISTPLLNETKQLGWWNSLLRGSAFHEQSLDANKTEAPVTVDHLQNQVAEMQKQAYAVQSQLEQHLANLQKSALVGKDTTSVQNQSDRPAINLLSDLTPQENSTAANLLLSLPQLSAQNGQLNSISNLPASGMSLPSIQSPIANNGQNEISPAISNIQSLNNSNSFGPPILFPTPWPGFPNLPIYTPPVFPHLPTLPPLPSLPPLPPLPTLPSLPSLPCIPGYPLFPNLPSSAALPNLPNFSNITACSPASGNITAGLPLNSTNENPASGNSTGSLPDFGNITNLLPNLTHLGVKPSGDVSEISLLPSFPVSLVQNISNPIVPFNATQWISNLPALGISQPIESGQLSALNNANIANPIGDLSGMHIANPIGNLSATHIANPIGDLSNKNIANPIGDSSNTNIANPIGDLSGMHIANPIVDLKNKKVANPIGDLSNKNIANPIGDLSNKNIANPIGDSSNTNIANPIGDLSGMHIANPIVDLNNKNIANPVGDLSNKNIVNPTGDLSNNNIVNPIGDLSNKDTGNSEAILSDLNITNPISNLRRLHLANETNSMSNLKPANTIDLLDGDLAALSEMNPLEETELFNGPAKLGRRLSAVDTLDLNSNSTNDKVVISNLPSMISGSATFDIKPDSPTSGNIGEADRVVADQPGLANNSAGSESINLLRGAQSQNLSPTNVPLKNVQDFGNPLATFDPQMLMKQITDQANSIQHQISAQLSQLTQSNGLPNSVLNPNLSQMLPPKVDISSPHISTLPNTNWNGWLPQTGNGGNSILASVNTVVPNLNNGIPSANNMIPDLNHVIAQANSNAANTVQDVQNHVKEQMAQLGLMRSLGTFDPRSNQNMWSQSPSYGAMANISPNNHIIDMTGYQSKPWMNINPLANALGGSLSGVPTGINTSVNNISPLNQLSGWANPSANTDPNLLYEKLERHTFGDVIDTLQASRLNLTKIVQDTASYNVDINRIMKLAMTGGLSLDEAIKQLAVNDVDVNGFLKTVVDSGLDVNALIKRLAGSGFSFGRVFQNLYVGGVDFNKMVHDLSAAKLDIDEGFRKIRNAGVDPTVVFYSPALPSVINSGAISNPQLIQSLVNIQGI